MISTRLRFDVNSFINLSSGGTAAGSPLSMTWYQSLKKITIYIFRYPWVYSSLGLKTKKVKIKAGVTIGPECRRS